MPPPPPAQAYSTPTSLSQYHNGGLPQSHYVPTFSPPIYQTHLHPTPEVYSIAQNLPYQSVPPIPTGNPQSFEPPPPMRVSGHTITNALTGQPIYTVSQPRNPHSGSNDTQLSLIHLSSGTPVGQASRHTSSSTIITIASSSTKLKHEIGSFSERWAYRPIWNPDIKWYFKNPRKLDVRLVDAKHGGREILTIKGEDMSVLREDLMPAQVGELILAALALREDIRAAKEINGYVGEAVLEVVLADAGSDAC